MGKNRLGWCLAALLAGFWGSGGLATAAGFGECSAHDPPEPPHLVEYRVQVLDETTGQPVPGIVIEAAEVRKFFWCGGTPPCGSSCSTTLETYYGKATTNAQGIGTVTFELRWCELADDDPLRWVKEIHQRFDAPRVVESPSPGVYTPYLLASWEVGGAYVDQIVRVVHESVLAHRFAPVLHRHLGFELQDDLGDIQESVQHTTISGYNVLGQRVYGPDVPPPLHAWEQWHWDTCGRGSVQVWWVMDLADDFRHAGAAPGQRPLYYHVFPLGSDVIVQYWLWFNANDLSEQWGVNSHEGDWEYLAVRATRTEDGWMPLQLNLSEHAGGRVLDAAEGWWSPTNSPTYQGMALGPAADRTHPHVWVAANSHAIYNRFDPAFTIEAPACGTWNDQLDYNLGSNPNGAHGFFRYDLLWDMQECWHAHEAHGHTYLDHLSGPFEELTFYGRYGRGSCTLPGSCPDEICQALGVFSNDVYQLGPRSPVVPEEPHKWRDFMPTPGRWGNDSQFIHFRVQPPVACYLGEYRTCGEGLGDTVAFRVPAHRADRPGVARVEATSGNPRFLEADGNGEILLGPAVDGQYVFRQSRVEGVGSVRLHVYPSGYPQQEDARDLRADILPHPCGPTEAAGPAEVRGRAVCVAPNPTGGGASIRLDRPAASSQDVRVCDVGGRTVWCGRIGPGESELRWNGVRDDGAPAASGVYLVFVGTGSARDVARITLAR